TPSTASASRASSGAAATHGGSDVIRDGIVDRYRFALEIDLCNVADRDGVGAVAVLSQNNSGQQEKCTQHRPTFPIKLPRNAAVIKVRRISTRLIGHETASSRRLPASRSIASASNTS